MSAQFVVDTDDPDSSAGRCGGKGATLRQLRRLGYEVPPFFIVCSDALLTMVGETASEENAPETLRRKIAEIRFTPELQTEILEAQTRCIPSGALMVVRSSAVAEDGQKLSFAGLYDTVLAVQDSLSLMEAIRQVWLSALSPRAVAYRRQMGLSPVDLHMAVIVQQMIAARSSGVCFTCHPATGATDVIMIQAVQGMGADLVSGMQTADSFVVSKPTGQITTETTAKHEQLIWNQSAGDAGHVKVAAEDRLRPALSETQVQHVVRVALAMESEFGYPLDIEFCFDPHETLFILQARPVTVVGADDSSVARDPDRNHELVWDNSNIIESYSGVTTPMTFSFIRRAYSIVYHCFAEVMGISPRVVHEHRDAFDNMLGLFRGRVYYNLKNWYRLVRLFPGYQYNRPFMEAMMGLKDPLLLEETPEEPGFLRRWFVELPALLRLLLRSGTNFAFIRSRVAAFHRHFECHFRPWATVDFDVLQPHEIMAACTKLEDALLWNWKTPIINDFYVMVYYGLLRKLCTDWCGDDTGALQNGLVCGEGGLLSDEPARHLMELVAAAANNPALQKILLEEPPKSLSGRIAADPRFAGFQSLLQTYLDEYGLRCVGELKLEEFSYRDQPEKLFRIIREYLRQESTWLRDRAASERQNLRIRDDAEQQCFAALSGSFRGWWRRRIFQRVLRNARRGVRNRENMRFARTRIYGLLRSMLRSVGKHLAARRILDNREDIFYLTLEEVRDFIRGTAVSTDLRGLAAVRRAEYDRYRDPASPAPADRFVTRGMACWGNSLRSELPELPAAESASLSGIGCCPGIVSGRVQVVRDVSQLDGFEGDILVAERTDPGWVPLYPAFSGILIERGSVLSHSAIVAREMGIPTIVGIAGLTAQLRSGQHVRMDGLAGTVRILADSP